MFFLLKVDGLVALMEGEHVGPFNLGNPGEFTMLELAEVCLRCFYSFLQSYIFTYRKRETNYFINTSLRICATYTSPFAEYFVQFEWASINSIFLKHRL